MIRMDSLQKNLSQVYRTFTFLQMDAIFISCVLPADWEEVKTPLTHSISLMDFNFDPTVILQLGKYLKLLSPYGHQSLLFVNTVGIRRTI